jgi:hypothetical protein
MRLLHGSNVEIKQPDLRKCQSKNDFGRGFYLTPQWQRAYLMAKRRASRDGGEKVVTSFQFNMLQAIEHGLKVKVFRGFSAAWSKFIILNRLEENLVHQYDVVIGPVADAFVDKEIERHKQKYGIHYLDTAALLDFAEHVSQFGNKYIQYCFCTKKALKELTKE